MPSEEFIAVVTEFEDSSSRKGRIAALEKMWLLQDPEIIEVVTLVYNEHDDKKTREKAGEVLGNYKGLYNALRESKSGSGGRSGLRNMLVLTLLLLLGANGALFFVANSDQDDERDLSAERTALLSQIETDMTTVRQLAIDLRATSRDIEEASTTVEAACAKSFSATPERIVLPENQTGFFPDINNFVNDPIGDYLVALDGAVLALDTWNTGCETQNINTDRVIDLAAAVVDSASAAIDVRIPELRDNPFVTPTPTPRPTNTPTITPEPSATPLPRDRDAVVIDLYTTVERVNIDANIIASESIAAIRRDKTVQAICTSVFWRPAGITLTGDEVGSFPEIAAYLADSESGFGTSISQAQAMMTEWDRVCRDSNVTDAELNNLNLLAQSVQDEVAKAQTSLLNTVGPKPN